MSFVQIPSFLHDVCRLAALLGLLLVGAQNLRGDEVIVATGEDGKGRTRRMGEVVDYTGETLVLRVSGGVETNIPAARVVEVLATQSAPHVRGDELFAEGKFAEALDQYRQAARQEQRAWVRRQLTAQAVWCYRYLGQHDFAVSAFLALAAQDPTTQYFDVIPLAWTSTQPGSAFEGQLLKWLQGESSIAALLAGSWLLTGRERTSASERLRVLAGDPDPRIALLAQAQLWRLEQATAPADAVRRWQASLLRIPEPLRAGPYYVIGQAMARVGAGTEAVLMLMRVPVLYPQQRELAAESLLAAGRELEKLQRDEEAAKLYRELVDRYQESPLTDLAQQRLETSSP